MADTNRKPLSVALIPARAGSTRVKDKNIRPLAGHPVLAYTIAAARASGVFDAVVLSTDSELYADIGRHYGAEVPFMRPQAIAGNLSPDIEWVTHTLEKLREAGRSYDVFSILRPTNPFRLPTTIQRAWGEFMAQPDADSLRAVEPCKQHPGKMWVIRGKRMVPLMPLSPAEMPWHSCQYQSLPKVYAQNASLEIAWSRVVFEDRTISGHSLIPFLTEGVEGVDINEEYDWGRAEWLLKTGEATLPAIDVQPWHG
jgi:CMP-N,N'-diacetyllegionaminic acid synthase